MIKAKHKRKLKRVVDELNKLIDDIREYEPDANYFFHGECNCIINIHTKDFNAFNESEWKKSKVESISEIINHADCGAY